MSSHGFLRPSLRRPLLALLAVGGVIMVAPARAVPSVHGSVSVTAKADADNASSDDVDGLVVAGIVAEVHMTNDGGSAGLPGLGDEVTGLPGTDLPDPSGGNLPDATELPDRLADMIGGEGDTGGLPGVPSLPDQGLPGLPGSGLPGSGIPGDGLPGLPVLPSVSGLDLSRVPGLPGLAGLPTAGTRSQPNPSVLPAGGQSAPGRLASDPSPSTPEPAVTTLIPGQGHAASPSGTLPRTGPNELFQGQAALALLGAGAATGFAARRRRA